MANVLTVNIKTNKGRTLASDGNEWSSAEATRYAQFAETSFSWRCIELPSLRALIEPCISQTTAALDLGCGSGRVIHLLRQLGISEDAIFGIDINPTLIDLAQQKYPRAKLECRDITETPYDALPKIDLATAHFVLQSLDVADLLQCLDELHRLLRPGGYLAVGLPHPSRVARQAGASYFARASHRIPAPWGGLTMASSLTVSEYLNCFIQAGFVLRRIDEPEICTCCRDEADAHAYLGGPTRLMILARANATSPLAD